MINVAVVYHSVSGNTRKMAELVCEGCRGIDDVEVRMMPIEDIDDGFLDTAHAVIFGCPTYEGTLSWQMKKFLDEIEVDLAGKLGGVFASQNWPGGGGAELTQLSMIAAMLVRGMLIYSGGIAVGSPYLHFGAVSARAPEDQGLYADRCRKLGENIAGMATDIFGEMMNDE
jgi:NAD(P)H dehydrogenase (quinone)